MIEFELASEFHEDSPHIKTFRTTPVTMESLEEARQVYLDSHPEFREFQFETFSSNKPAPTSDQVNQGTYIHDRWKSE
jgi:hypothetical protein